MSDKAGDDDEEFAEGGGGGAGGGGGGGGGDEGAAVNGEEGSALGSGEVTTTDSNGDAASQQMDGEERSSPDSSVHLNDRPESISSTISPPPLSITPSDDVISTSSITNNHSLHEKKSPVDLIHTSDLDDDVLSPIEVHRIPTLRLNASLASDPAANPDAKDIKKMRASSSDDNSFSNHSNHKLIDDFIPASQDDDISLKQHSKTKRENVIVSPLVPTNIELPPRVPVYMCGPCGIRFSSASTLEAHQTYYCSHRKDQDENSSSSKPPSVGDGSEPPAKTIKTGKQYACTQCSYSADKKVSLNRHMRMHQTSPAPSSHTSNGDDNPSQQQKLAIVQMAQPAQPAAQPLAQASQSQLTNQVDRYCSDCDIRFSSTKTYRAHKQHYCSSRHREGVAAAANSTSNKGTPHQKSGSQSPPETPKSPPAVVQHQPFLALPTNPIIIIPYSLVRSASVMPGPLSTLVQGVTNSDSACFIFQNGTLQPIAYAIAPPPSQTPTQPSSRGPTPNITAQSGGSETATPVPNNNSSSANSTNSGETMKVASKRSGSNKETTTTPLDLSVRRLSAVSNSMREHSLSLFSAMSAENLLMNCDTFIKEGKDNLSVSDDSLTPEQIVCAPSLPGSPPLTPSPKRRSHSPRGGGTISVSPNSNHSQSMLMRPLLPAELALRLSDPSTINSIPSQLMVKQSLDLAIRLSSNSSNSESPQQISPLLNMQNNSPTPSGVVPAVPPIPPQIFVKQGVSKCKECNIVFCKLENYLAHKKHYCSSRNLDDSEGPKTSPPISPQSTSPSGATLAYQQLICAACGIKFTSLDNLQAHQMYYCPKRAEVQVQTSPAPPAVKERCSKCKTMHEVGQPCAVTGQGSYKCPICDVVSVNSTEARRHMETHSGVKAFRCTICRYKGNTLRGMRTHIRMHFDKKSNDFNEENFITCILEDDTTEIPPVSAAAAIVAPPPPPPPPPQSVTPTLLQQDALMSQNYNCDSCNYSSTFKGNVLRHKKLVHSGAVPLSSSPPIGEGGESLLPNGEIPPIAMHLNKTIKVEPEDLKSDMEETMDNNNVSTDGENELVIDEPDIVIKTEIKEINEVSHQIRQSSPQSHSQNKRMRLSPPSSAAVLPPTTTATASATVITNQQNHLLQHQQLQQPPRTPSLSPDLNLLSSTGPKYCKTCDITFNYLNTFIAHKKFYCKNNKIVDSSNQNGPSPPTAANVVVTRATETSVL